MPLERTEGRIDAGVNEFLAEPISARGPYSPVHAIIERPRPFIRIRGFNKDFGPDRRRQTLVSDKGPERRKEAVAEPVEEGAGILNREEIEALLNG